MKNIETLKELMQTNEDICKRIDLLDKIISIYKKAFLDIGSSNPIVEKAQWQIKMLTLQYKTKRTGNL